MITVRVNVQQDEYKDIFDNRQRFVAVNSTALREGSVLEIGYDKKPGCFRSVTHLSGSSTTFGMSATRIASIRPLNSVEKDALRNYLNGAGRGEV